MENSMTWLLLLAVSVITVSAGFFDLVSHPVSSTLKKCQCEKQYYDVAKVFTGELSICFKHFNCVGTCQWMIKPHPTKQLNVHVELLDLSFQTTFRIFQFIQSMGSTVSDLLEEAKEDIQHGFQSLSNRKVFKIPPNVGIMFEMKLDYGPRLVSGWRVRIKYERVEPEEDSCNNGKVILDQKMTSLVVQKSRKTDWPMCKYVIEVPENIKETRTQLMVIVENGNQNKISITCPKNDSDIQNINFGTDFSVLTNESQLILSVSNDLENGYAMLPQIIVKKVQINCNCPPDVELHQNSTAIIWGPGYPSDSCPGMKCSTNVKMDDVIEEKLQFHSIVWISINAVLPETDSLTLKQNDNKGFGNIPDTYKCSTTFSNVVVPYNSMTIDYVSAYNLLPRKYGVILKSLSIPTECHCSYSDQLKLNTPGRKIITIPMQCTFFHCHWTIEPDQKPRWWFSKIDLTYEVQNPLADDEVHVSSRGRKTISTYSDLQYVRKYTTSNRNMDFAFIRKNGVATEETRLIIEWNVKEDEPCPLEGIVVHLDDQKHSLANKEWPQAYEHSETCTYYFVAPENHIIQVNIDVINIERYHDRLEFYNGDNTDIKHLIKSFSGFEENQVLHSSGERLTVQFITDENESVHGFHINLLAIKRSLDEPVNDGVFEIVVLCCVFGLLIMLVILFFVYKKKYFRRVNLEKSVIYTRTEKEPIRITNMAQ